MAFERRSKKQINILYNYLSKALHCDYNISISLSQLNPSLVSLLNYTKNQKSQHL